MPPDPFVFLRSTSLFQGVPDAALLSIAAACVETTLAADEVLFRQGAAGDALYVVVEGRLAVLAETGEGPPRAVGTVGVGECVGEGALLLAGRRTATVRAETPSRLIGLSRDGFEHAVSAEPGLRAVLTTLVARRMPALRAAEDEIFGALDDTVRRRVEGELSWVYLQRDEILFREGDPADALYVVLQGRLQVVRERPDRPLEVVTEIGRGQPVGEIGLLTGDPRSSTVRAARDTELIRFSEQGFRSLLQQSPQALMPLLRTLARRLQTTTVEAPPAAARSTVIAIVPLGGAALDDFLAGFLPDQEAHGRIRVLDSRAFDAEHGPGASQMPPDDARSMYVNEWLHGQESAHDVLVFVADPEAGEWSRRCVRQADRIVLVARAEAAPGLGAFEPLVGRGRTSAGRVLVLLHGERAARPSGTAAWLDATGVDRHHHVRDGTSADARRVSRFLGGRAVGLVLSGGGARAFAHAGLIRALLEAGVPIDFLGGVSMGSLVAACHALGFRFPGTIDTLRRTFVDTRPHRGYTVPLVSVFSPRKTEKALHDVFGDTPIEDLWINYFCVAANLTRATVHVFQRGPVWKAMRASGSFPGLLPPVPFHGDLLVDGGVLDNLPVELMQALCPGPILVSDTSQDVDLNVDPDLEWSPSPTELLLERLRARGKRTRVPGAATVLLRALECHQAGHRRRQRAGAAFVFDLPVGRYGLIDFPSIDPIVEAGYRYATTAIERLPPEIPRGTADK
ncbi:MAG TPA: cyclic nucleotide-binding domain-containing protein [Vicinamibacteria bacterium]|nr:cyclic nucleotide-binding domain-containing protein [Vicinamibacteria bacterium]